MRRILILAAAVFIIASCGTSNQALYYWGGTMENTSAYDYYSYKSFKTQDGRELCNLLCTYEKMVSNPGGTRKTPPPGICAEYGYLLLQPQTAETFAQYATPEQKKIFGEDFATVFYEKGQQLIQKEMEMYPESQVFLMPLFKKWSKR